MTEFLNQPLILPLSATAALFAVAAALRVVIGHRIRRGASILNDLQRRQLFYLRSGITTVLLVGLAMIWLGRIENALLSLTAVAVAIAIATKELLMCLSGFLLRTTGRLFSHGDWIECSGFRGEVSDHTLLSTTLLETDLPENGYGYTGRTVTLPNSTFLTHPVLTAPAARRFVVHRFRITLDAPVDAAAAMDWLRARADELCAPFAEEARRQADALDRRLGVDVSGPEPSVGVMTTVYGQMQLAVMLFCPPQRAAELERRLGAEFLDAVHRGDLAPRGANPARAGEAAVGADTA